MSTLVPLVSIVLVGLSASHVRAQITTNATCLSTWQGLYNSRGQSPCLVAAYLAGTCNGGQYNVPNLFDGEHYIGPTSRTANDCLCNTVVYNLMGGCSTCQNASSISWSSWSTNCPSVLISAFPEQIPPDTSVPGWAYEDVPQDGTFDPNAALSNNSPESTATLVQQTNTGTRTATATAGVGGSDDDDDSGGSNTGAIAGGVVGGVVGLALLALLAFFLVRRSRNNKNNKADVFYNANNNNDGGMKASLTGSTYNAGPGGANAYTPVPYTPGAYETSPAPSSGVFGIGNSPPPSMMTQQQRLYDPNDPSTFPSAISPSPVSVHQQTTGQSYTPSFPQPSTQTDHTTPVANQGMYRGVAEV